MNPWIAALTGAAVMYVIAVIITLVDEPVVDDVFVAPLDFVYQIIMFIPVFVWGLFRHVAIPVNKDRQKDPFIQRMIKESWKITPQLYFHHDKKARRICNRFFFFRLEK